MSKMKEEFKPKIVTFMCNWCGYQAEDLEELSELKITPSIRVIRVMCSGRVHPALILDALNKGSDGVLVCGCHEGECHYISGNVRAEEGVEKTKKLLDLLRIETERVKLERISPSEGKKFTDVLKCFSEQLISMGPISLVTREVNIL